MAMWHIMFGMSIGLVLSVGLTLMTIMSKTQALPKQERRFHSTPDEQCAICLVNMTDDDMTYLHCGHAIHDECLKNLRKHRDYKCPTCREKFV